MKTPSYLFMQLVVAFLGTTAGTANAAFDMINISLEDLAQARIVSTPKFSENPDQIPSTVSILTARDIRTFGWRTLSDALRSLQGYMVTDDHTYNYASSRGVSSTGDYRARMQILIDGISINENIYAGAPTGSDFPLDLALVERIEVIRGPSASVYGGDSMFGVINIVTRNGQDVGGGEASLSYGSGTNSRLRATWGGQIGENDLLISATGFNSNGYGLSVHDLDTSGAATRLNHVDAEDGGQFFLRLRGSDWRFTVIHGRRERQVPTGSYGTYFNDPSHVEADRYSLIDLGKDWKIDANNTFYQRFYLGEYGYDGRFPYDYSPVDAHLINVDKARGDWWGMEHRLVSQRWQGHRLTAGLEYKSNTRQDQFNFDQGYGCLDKSSTLPCLASRKDSQQYSVYLQDEIQLGDATLLTLGLRNDRISHYGGFVSPRLGLIHDAGATGLFKILYGSAFRTPQVYELFYITPSYSYGNPDVRPEKLDSLEFSWEKRFSAQSRLTATYNTFRIRNLINPDSTGIAVNGSPVYGQGIEVEYEHDWQNGWRLRGGYSGQRVRNLDSDLDNSPHHMVKFNLAIPTGVSNLIAGLEGQWISSRSAGLGQHQLPAYALANLNFNYQPSGQRWETSFGIYNLFDHRYNDPTSPDTATAIQRWQMPQLGRTWLLRGTLHF
jgi:iron complex outermembrane receptor protein